MNKTRTSSAHVRTAASAVKAQAKPGAPEILTPAVPLSVVGPASRSSYRRFSDVR